MFGGRGPTLAFGLLLACVVAGPAGCNSLPPGPVASVVNRPVLASGCGGEVYLLRGWRGLWSEGIDQLAGKLRAKGFDAMVFRADQAKPLAAALSERFAGRPGAGPPGPLVLIGFSYGADDAIEVSEELGRHGIAVDLLVTIDPVTPPAVPGNVRACRNYYEPNGAWDALPWLRGIPLHEAAGGPPGRLQNVNVRDRPDLAEPGTSHAAIAADPKLHQAVVRDVLAACPGAGTHDRVPLP